MFKISIFVSAGEQLTVQFQSPPIIIGVFGIAKRLILFWSEVKKVGVTWLGP